MRRRMYESTRVGHPGAPPDSWEQHKRGRDSHSVPLVDPAVIIRRVSLPLDEVTCATLKSRVVDAFERVDERHWETARTSWNMPR